MLAPKSDFIGLEGVAHLATGGQPPMLKAQRAAFEAFISDKARGQPGYEHHWNVSNSVKEQLARLTGLVPGDFALVGSASEGIARVLSAFAWREGDNVVTAEADYASGRYGLARLRGFGVEPRLVACRDHLIDVQDLITACDFRTRLVYVSQVSSLTGQHLDLETLSQALRKRGICLLVDVSHALGVVPVEGEQCDFLVCCSYKWLLGTHTGILGWNRRRWPEFEPLGVGWNSAESGEGPGDYRLLEHAGRAEVGNANHLDAYLLRPGLDYLLGVGIDRIADHARGLGGELHVALERMGLPVLTPAAAGERAGSIAFAHPHPQEVARRAEEEGVLIWGDNGRVRASIHLFVEPDDIERYVRLLPQILGD